MKDKIKSIIKYVVIIAAVVVGAYFYSFVKMNKSADSGNKNSKNIFTFTATEDNMLSVKLTLPDNTIAEGINVKLLDDNGNEISSAVVTGNSSVTFKFDKLTGTKNHEYKIVSDSEAKADMTKAVVTYKYKGFRLQTMIVFILCMAYLFGLTKVLGRLFRK